MKYNNSLIYFFMQDLDVNKDTYIIIEGSNAILATIFGYIFMAFWSLHATNNFNHLKCNFQVSFVNILSIALYLTNRASVNPTARIVVSL